MDMEKLLSAYDDLTQPSNIKSHFKTDEEFRLWLNGSSVEDLKCTLEAFAGQDLFEDCVIIQKVINKKLRI